MLLRRIAHSLVSKLPESEPWKFSFHLIEDKQVNAFAFPGGPIFFYTGILEKFKSEDDVAAVVAHEMTHVRNEHWARQYAESQNRQLGLMALLMLTDANRSAATAAVVGEQILFGLPYSRKQETEADLVGCDLMLKAGYDPRRMAFVMRQLGGGGGPEWLKTHPDSERRAKDIEAKVKKLPGTLPSPMALPSWWPRAGQDASSPADDRDGSRPGRTRTAASSAGSRGDRSPEALPAGPACGPRTLLAS